MADGGKSEREVAVQQQERLQFYAIGLVFTLLAASVQTSKLGTSAAHDVFELGAWVCLLASGIAGLWYLEMNPALRLKVTQLDEYREELTNFRRAQTAGQTSSFVAATQLTQPITASIANRQAAVDALDRLIPKLEKWQERRYSTFRFGFLLGLVLVAVARAWPAFT